MASSLLLPVVRIRWPYWLDSAISAVPRTRACRFSSARPVSCSLLWYASTTPAIGSTWWWVRWRSASSAASLTEWSDEYADGIATVWTASAPERVDRDRRDQRRVDAAGQAQRDRAEAVLAHVVAGAEDERRVQLGVGIEPVDASCGGAARTALSGSARERRAARRASGCRRWRRPAR